MKPHHVFAFVCAIHLIHTTAFATLCVGHVYSKATTGYHDDRPPTTYTQKVVLLGDLHVSNHYETLFSRKKTNVLCRSTARALFEEINREQKELLLSSAHNGKAYIMSEDPAAGGRQIIASLNEHDPPIGLVKRASESKIPSQNVDYRHQFLFAQSSPTENARQLQAWQKNQATMLLSKNNFEQIQHLFRCTIPADADHKKVLSCINEFPAIEARVAYALLRLEERAHGQLASAGVSHGHETVFITIGAAHADKFIKAFFTPLGYTWWHTWGDGKTCDDAIVSHHLSTTTDYMAAFNKEMHRCLSALPSTRTPAEFKKKVLAKQQACTSTTNAN